MRASFSFAILFALLGCGGELELNNSNEGETIIEINTGNNVASNCGVDELICGGVCTDIRNNASHCGSCGTPCAGSCIDYQCTDNANNGTGDNNGSANNGMTSTSCDFEICNEECTNTANNPNHCGTCNNACASGQVCQSNQCVTLGEIEGILVATNEARASGVDCGQYGPFPATTPLTLDDELNRAAQVHAQDMADNNFFSHTGSDRSSFSTRIGRTEFSGQPIGENIAGGGTEPAGIVQRWIDSDGHCRNLMNPQATKLGVGYTQGGQYGTLWVQVFAR